LHFFSKLIASHRIRIAFWIRIALFAYFSHFRTFFTFLVVILQFMHQKVVKKNKCEKMRKICKKKCENAKNAKKCKKLRSANAMQKWNQNSHCIALLCGKVFAFFRIAFASRIPAVAFFHNFHT
jgi:short subunit fatty acids transporter